MIFLMARTLFVCGLLVVAASIQTASAEEIEATLIVPSGNEASEGLNFFKFNNDIKGLPYTELETIDFSEVGFHVVNVKMDDKDLDALLTKGYELAPSLSVELFSAASCEETPENLDRDTTAVSNPDVPPNVCSVVGRPAIIPDPTNLPSVWILDSGVDQRVVNQRLVNVAAKVNCVRDPCNDSSANTRDHLGHGTMIAGIVGGTWVEDSNRHPLGLAGVAPNVQLKIIKTFGISGNVKFWGAPLRSLEYLKEKVQSGEVLPGDVVIISWGFRFIESAKKNKYREAIDKIDKILHYLADRHVKIVMAAGNAESTDPGDKWPWVQAFGPANLAPYSSTFLGDPMAPKPAGGLFSVSAAKTTYTGSAWSDELWIGSAFGAKYAQPGSEITSLWISDGSRLQKNVCSGTSFAAPSFAGLLALGPLPATTPRLPTSRPYPKSDEVVFVREGTPTAGDHPKCN
jgi:hypothetical protein